MIPVAMTERTRVPREVTASLIREALVDAALFLFARDGFDATHTDRVAEQAGVSPRTFFRYFPTKEAVVFHRDYGFMRSFAATYITQPATMSDYEALWTTFETLSGDLDELRHRLETYRSAVDSSPVLIGHEHVHFRDHERTVAVSIAQRRGLTDPDETCLTLASVSLALYQRALRRWLEGPLSTSLAVLIDDEYASLRRVV
jgi:AcrR family transcriptional regulator